MIAHILSCFEICKSVDDAGNEVDLVLEYDDTSIVRYELLDCRKKWLLTRALFVLDGHSH